MPQRLFWIQNRRQRRLRFAAIALVFVILLSSIISFNSSLNDRLKQNAVLHMMDINESQRLLVSAHLSSMARELHTDITNIDGADITNTEELHRYVKEVAASGSFDSLSISSIVDDSGRTEGWSTDGTPITQQPEHVVSKLQRGELHVERRNNKIEITIPRYDDSNRFIGMASGRYPTHRLSEYSKGFVQRHNGSLYIMDGDGKLLASAGEMLSEDWSSIDSLLAGATFTEGSLAKMHENVKVLVRDYMMIKIGGKELLVTYSPVDIENWYIVGIVPYSNVSSNANNIRGDAYNVMIKLAIAGLLFAGYLFISSKQHLDELRMQQKQMRASEARYKLISARSKDIIVEYDLRKGLVVHCENGGILDSPELRGAQFAGKVVAMGIVHPEDAGLFHDSLHDAAAGRQDIEVELRVKLTACGYKWHRLSMACVFDENGKPWRLVARANDIDQQKMEANLLKQRAARDPLTRLYNKGATHSEIIKILSTSCESTHALMIIDIDNFKQFNDNYGHLFGDKLLTAVAGSMHDLFRSSDVVGRVGGDEFMVFCRDVGDSGNASRRASQLVELFADVGRSLEPPVTVSCSVGVSMCPANGTGFEELYRNADSALYAAKERGKNGYALFDANTETVVQHE